MQTGRGVSGHLSGTFIRVAAFLVRDPFTQTRSPAARVGDVCREDKRQRPDGESSLALHLKKKKNYCKMIVDQREVAKIVQLPPVLTSYMTVIRYQNLEIDSYSTKSWLC